MAAKITAFIVCFNEESQIERALVSINWCDEIIIVDSGSKDKTLEICKKYTEKIYHRDWTGYADQKRFALEKSTSEWALNVDADEEVSPELKIEIQKVLENDDTRVNGYLLSRVVFYMNRWWRHGGWYPEYRLRLCRRSKTTWGGDEPHEKAIVEGSTRKLSGELHHYTYKSIQDQIKSLVKHAEVAADTMLKKNQRVGVLQIIFNPLFRFIKFYFFKLGFIEGVPGLIVAGLESYYVFLKYSRAWYQRKFK